MTPDTCPYCGAPRSGEGRERIYWSCGTNSARQGRQCARYVRVRISQLRRMADAARSWIAIMDQSDSFSADEPGAEWIKRNRLRLDRLLSDCLREIDRLRGGA